MPVGAGVAISGAASLASGWLGSNAAKSAADKQAQANSDAATWQKQMYYQTRSDFAPYMSLGSNAANSLSSLYGFGGGSTGNSGGAPNYSGFFNSPDFQFASQMGNQQVQNYLASTGQTQGSAGLAYVSQFNQGLASQQYGNYFNRLMGLTQVGQSSAQSLAGAAATSGAQVGQSLSNIGQNQASGIVGSANAWGGALGGVGNAALLGGIYKNYNPTSFNFGSNPTSLNPSAYSGNYSLGNLGGTGGVFGNAIV